jgi:hypothetical protein
LEKIVVQISQAVMKFKRDKNIWSIKNGACKGDMRIGKTPKKLASICCPQHRETKADTIKANRRRGPRTREKDRSKRINLEGNTHAQEINVSQLPV